MQVGMSYGGIDARLREIEHEIERVHKEYRERTLALMEERERLLTMQGNREVLDRWLGGSK